MAKPYSEEDFRQWLEPHIGQLISLIANLAEAKASIESRSKSFIDDKHASLQELVAKSIQAILDLKALHALSSLEEGAPLFSLGTNVSMIESPLPGRNPSADILAAQTMSGGYVIVELKVDAGAARQAITELSAYARGLEQRYWSMSSFDAIWLLISTDFRPTLSEAVAYQQLVSNRCIVPLKATVTVEGAQITNVSLSVENVASQPDPYLCDALFCDHIYDCVATYTSEPIPSPDIALHFVSSGFERTGASGFCFHLVPTSQERHLPHPYGLVVVTINSFKLYLKVLKLRELVGHGLKRGSADYSREILDEVIQVSVDADIGTFVTSWANQADQDPEMGTDIAEMSPPIDPRRSLRELSSRERNSETLAFKFLLKLLAGDDESREVYTPELGDCLSPHTGEPQFREDNISSVRYFGAMHDLMTQIANYLRKHDSDFEGKSVPEVYESSRLLLKIFGKINLRLGA